LFSYLEKIVLTKIEVDYMGRPATKPARLKDGFYIEVKNQGSGGILIRRDTKDQMLLAAEDYSRMKEVTILGEMKNDKWVDKGKGKK
jgi:hypothetical protein